MFSGNLKRTTYQYYMKLYASFLLRDTFHRTLFKTKIIKDYSITFMKPPLSLFLIKSLEWNNFCIIRYDIDMIHAIYSVKWNETMLYHVTRQAVVKGQVRLLVPLKGEKMKIQIKHNFFYLSSAIDIWTWRIVSALI